MPCHNQCICVVECLDKYEQHINYDKACITGQVVRVPYCKMIFISLTSSLMSGQAAYSDVNVLGCHCKHNGIVNITCVCVKMVSQQCDCSKCASAQVTLMWPLICVALHVSVQVGTPWTSVATKLTLESLLHTCTQQDNEHTCCKCNPIKMVSCLIVCQLRT